MSDDIDGAILIVDDERVFRGSLALRLRLRGCRVVEAADGGAALELARTQDKIAVVILDGKMPGLGSSELLCALKRALPEVPVVMLSGSAGIRDASAVVDGQVFAELQKPCELEELMRTIRSAIRATGQQPPS